ncbi:MAG: hypothetical protein IJE46_03530 [Clostridia bacterium]|nr:hypothetical protein [Clostridia bacterium]
MENINICDTCVYATVLVTDEVLCSKYGVLNNNCACKRYKEDLTKREIRKKRTVKISNLSD